MASIEQASQVIDLAAEWVRLILETLGAITIALGAAAAVGGLVRAFAARTHASFTSARFTLARYLALALEFQLAADVLETAIAPEWSKIGQLAAIATIRTALNYFLGRELREEREQISQAATSTAA
jgi:uncharacterized membrane protein